MNTELEQIALIHYTNFKLINIALSQYGITEIPGDEHNPEILKWFHETGRKWVSTDETPNCDAFIDWVAMKAGGQPSPGLLAREWLKYGKVVKKPKLGDLVIFWRVSKDSIYGHVAIYIRETAKYVYVLGANQNNQVCIRAYRKDRVLGYRRLVLPMTVTDIFALTSQLSPAEKGELADLLHKEPTHDERTTKLLHEEGPGDHQSFA